MVTRLSPTPASGSSFSFCAGGPARVTFGCVRRRACLSALLAAIALAACGGSADGGLDPTPERLDGSSSYEFEQDDLERAEDASDAVKEYCADAVSEAQRIGCESHVTDEELS